eukprot:2936753-Amphidinium_carterae.2
MACYSGISIVRCISLGPARSAKDCAMQCPRRPWSLLGALYKEDRTQSVMHIYISTESCSARASMNHEEPTCRSWLLAELENTAASTIYWRLHNRFTAPHEPEKKTDKGSKGCDRC